MSVQIDGSTGNIIAIKADYSGDVSIGGTLTYEDVTNIDAVGLITARNGIKVDDLGVQVGTGATIDGATNTLTFLTNGSERFRVDSSGNLGLGESSSIDARLHVNSGTDNTALFLESTDGDVNLGMADNAGSCRLLQAGGNLRFRTGGNANAFGTGDSERMVLDSSGNIGLGGITSPTWASDGGIHLGDDYGIGFGDGGSGRPDFQVITAGDGRLDLRCGFGADDPDISIDSSGRLLVGTTTAGAFTNRRVSIVTSSGTTALELRSATDGDSRIVFTDSTDSSNSGSYKGQINYDQSSDYMSFNTNGNNERMRIDSSGHIYIGRTVDSDSQGTTIRNDGFLRLNRNGSTQAVFN